MLVGPSGGGKTSNLNVLKNSLTQLLEDGYYKVHTHTLNPKSITMDQLYGCYNDLTKEWTDGVIAFMFRNVIRDET